MKSKKHKKFKWLKLIILGGLAGFFIKKKSAIKKVEDNFEKFIKEEKDEVENLVKGKRSCRDFACRSGRLFKDFFIPHHGNGHKPKFLRTKTLSIIVVVLVLIKVITIGSLFLVYPSEARMSGIISRNILELTNQERANLGLPALNLNSTLSASAHAKAEDMLINNYFSHQSLNGFWPWDWIDRGQYEYLFVAENLAMNFTSAQTVHKALMRSPMHQKNIINDKYTDIGLAVVTGEMNGKKTNVLVQLFASQKIEPAKVAVAPEAPLSTSEEQPVELEDEVLIEEVKPMAEQVAEAEVLAEENLPDDFLENEQDDSAAISDVSMEIISEDMPVSPNVDISAQGGPALGWENNKLILAKISPNSDNSGIGWLTKLIIFTKYIFVGILIVLAIALLVNIFVRIKIQHKGVILRTILVIAVVASLLAVRAHIIEEISGGMLIL